MNLKRKRTLEEVFDNMFDDAAILEQTGGSDDYDCDYEDDIFDDDFDFNDI